MLRSHSLLRRAQRGFRLTAKQVQLQPFIPAQLGIAARNGRLFLPDIVALELLPRFLCLSELMMGECLEQPGRLEIGALAQRLIELFDGLIGLPGPEQGRAQGAEVDRILRRRFQRLFGAPDQRRWIVDAAWGDDTGPNDGVADVGGRVRWKRRQYRRARLAIWIGLAQ